ncbi:MAG: terminase small subunit [Phycisphaerales bacterium]|jgi:phage terminase small subunit
MPKKKIPDPKTEQLLEQRFAEEWLVDLDAGAAAERAGYRYKSRQSRGRGGAKLLKKRSVQEAIRTRLLEKFGHSDPDALAVKTIEELCLLAFSDLNDYAGVGNDGRVIIAEGRSEKCTKAAKSAHFCEQFDARTGKLIRRSVKIELWDKNRAMRNLMEYLKMLGPNVGIFVGGANGGNQATQVNVVFVGGKGNGSCSGSGSGNGDGYVHNADVNGA